MLSPCNINPQKMLAGYVGTGGIAKGQLGMVSSNTIIDATEGQSTAVLFGVAADDYDAGEVGEFYPLLGCEFIMPVYQGGATDSVTDSMVGGTAYDLYVNTADHMLDLNDTTGGMFVIQRYDNSQQIAWVRVLPALVYCG